MPNLAKVIKGLTAIEDEAYDRWVHRPYIEDPLITLIRDNIPDALALLRGQDKTANDPPFQRHDCGALIVYRGRDVCPNCGRKVKW